MIVVGDCHLAMKQNITKQLVRGSVWDSDSIIAGIARGGNSETHVCLKQYQFRVFKNVDCLMSLRRRYLDKAVMLLFRSLLLWGEGPQGHRIKLLITQHKQNKSHINKRKQNAT